MLRRRIGEISAKVAAWATSPKTPITFSGPALTPLTPEFDPAQHQVYVDHLNAAIEDSRVRNIALTGRYGTGKSSILEQFARQPTKKKHVLSLALSTLGPEQSDDSGSEKRSSVGSTTNRIEKELVKQLLHREKPSRLRQSRYQRIEVLPRWRAVLEAVAVVGAIAAVLWALGVFPNVPGAASDGHSWPVRVGAVVAVGVVPVMLVAWVRLAVHNRFAISELSAGGASISLTRTGSYFDEYLDEIVYFFETAGDIQIVLFEDLDRFDDPGIFEALRELNTLLNSSKQVGDRTIRFVYALRDSVFEKLGRDASDATDDAARAEATRANRTKFFDLVIPIVPFITHRNARDLLTQILKEDDGDQVLPVSPALVDLTARHIPDMRLLRNIRNEYSVFAHRLIAEKQGMKSLSADQLFALIVYKNIHLADFEDLLLGRSKLDDLYRFSRQLVTEAINVRRARLRELADELALPQALATKSERWGQQLSWYVEEVRRAKEAARPGYTVTGFVVGGTDFEAARVTDAEFWHAVGSAGTGLTVRFDRQGNPDHFQIDAAGISRLLCDELATGGWGSVERASLDRERAQVEGEIDLLRTADFVELARHPQFRVSSEHEPRSFSDALASTVESELGRALVSDGYIDRYYTLYVAQYYGDHVPPNAMNFIVQNVDANRSDVNYPFASDDEISAVMRETRGHFLAEKSAYNTAIVDYLFRNDEAGAKTVLDSATRAFGEDERAFLDAYLADGSSTNAAATYLGSTWPLVFVHLVTGAELSVGSRLELVSAALAGASRDITYEFNDAVRAYLQQNHQAMRVVARKAGPDSLAGDALTEEQVGNAVSALGRAGVVFGELSGLSSTAVRLVVENDSYALTNANLRTILGEGVSLSLDSIGAINQGVYEDCLRRVDEYLVALFGDTTATDTESGDESVPSTEAVWTVESPSAFAGVVADLVANSGSAPAAVLSRAHPDCVLEDLTEVPTVAWPALAETRRVSPTLANVDNYIREVGDVDASLAATVVQAGHILARPDEAVEEGDATEAGETQEMKSRVASAILKASGSIPDPASRVVLASSLGLGDWFALTNVQPEEGRLLGHLVEAGIWSDEASLIGHFANPSWDTLSFAIQQSARFTEYMVPALLDPRMTIELLNSAGINLEVKRAVLERFNEFIEVANRDALVAAGKAALATDTLLAIANIASIAAGTGDSDLVVRLLGAHGRSVSADEIVSTLAHLPSPYNQLAQSGAKLEFPRDEHHEAVLKRVHAAGLIISRSHRASLLKRARIEVTVK